MTGLEMERGGGKKGRGSGREGEGRGVVRVGQREKARKGSEGDMDEEKERREGAKE